MLTINYACREKHVGILNTKMKTLITIILFLLSGLMVIAQDAHSYQKTSSFHPVQKSHLLKALKKYEKDGDVNAIQDISLLLFKADSAVGNYQSAISYLKQNDRLKDSLFNLAKNKQIKELQIAYHTEQRDKNMINLRNSAKLRALNLKHAQSTRTWIIIGSGLLLVIAFLLYRQAKVTRKTNRVISLKNTMLQQLITEKEWLLKEVHHRVKNNLHTVICLLESQAKYLEDDALEAVESSQHRIFAMSLIHQKLYRTDHIKTIDMTEYIPELVNNLRTSFGVAGFLNFTFKIDLITLHISYAIPLGLIINEAVTNSIKHAFPGYKAGEIHVALVDDNTQMKLEISDNGIGLQEDFTNTEYHSLGIEMMNGLSAEIDASIEFVNAGGARVTVIFCPALQM